jgi:hypothetical protein
MVDFYPPEGELSNMITLKQDPSTKAYELKFAKCDPTSSAKDEDCNYDAYYQQFYVAVFVVLNDFQSTSNYLSPY